MPTVIALDVSLSMLRPVPSLDTSESSTRLSLAGVGINTLLDYFQAQMKLEYIALVTFSSTCEVVVPFTRDFDTIRHKLPSLEEGDRTCFQTALSSINQLVLNEWGHQTPVQIIMITDGTAGVGPIGRARITESLPLPPNFPGRLHIVTITTHQDTSLQYALPLYHTIIELASSSTNANVVLPRGSVYSLDHLTVAAVNSAITKLTEQQYPITISTLKCGQLECRVQLYPPPARTHHCSTPPAALMHVIGFISHQDLGTPITLSRHLIIPISHTVAPASKDYEPKTKDTASTEGSEDDMSDPSKIPNFCVLLHGALKVESMAAIVQIGEDWWGTVVAWCDSARARRSCLLLSVLNPGPTAAPWLSHLGHLGPEDDLTSSDTFPIKCVRSYSGGGGGGGGGGVWSRTHALIADVQKVLRHARKLPDKTHHMYKELNRLRRMAISLGFTELLTHMAAILERECALLGGINVSEAALQLAHAAAALRDPLTQTDIQHNLMPHKIIETTHS